MRELSTCDFCGGSATGVYEVVPDDVAGVAARRMVLCADCRDTLAAVVDPLLDRLRRREGTEPTGETDAEPGVSPGDREPRDRAPDVRADAPAADPADAAPSPDADANADADADRDADAGADPAAPADGAVDETDGAADGAADETDTADSDAPPAGEPTQPASQPAARPPGYRKVVRLLENRDAAIPRSDLEDLVTNAYDVTPDEFQAAVDAAVENGHLEATDEGLRRTP